MKELEFVISYDSKGNPLEGGKKYKIHLPSAIPASEFWSIVVYDSISRLMIHTDQPWPSVHSNNKRLICNKDGSVDAWFSHEKINFKESNWVKTIPGKQWYLILRLYYPSEPLSDKNWVPGEIEELV